MKIIIIEDNTMLASKVAKKLSRNGYSVSVYNNLVEFHNKYSRDPDLYIIDLGLPDGNGFEIIKWVRDVKNKSTPIIITSGYDDTERKVYGLDLGADDYITKPYNPEELLARIRSVLRRKLEVTTNSIIKYRDVVFDIKTKKVENCKIPVYLTKRETELLEFFLYNKGKLLSKTQLINSVWGEHDVFLVSDNTINVTISKIRKKLWNNFGLTTVVNEGYILED